MRNTNNMRYCHRCECIYLNFWKIQNFRWLNHALLYYCAYHLYLNNNKWEQINSLSRTCNHKRFPSVIPKFCNMVHPNIKWRVFLVNRSPFRPCTAWRDNHEGYHIVTRWKWGYPLSSHHTSVYHPLENLVNLEHSLYLHALSAKWKNWY